MPLVCRFDSGTQLTDEAERTLDLPKHRAAMLGPFEEEEEGTSVTSDVFKVKGEDPATPGLLLKGIDPGTVTIPQYQVNKTKQNTHTVGI